MERLLELPEGASVSSGDDSICFLGILASLAVSPQP